MHLYHINSGIVAVVHDKDLFQWVDTTNNAVVFEIEELDPSNKEVCADVSRTFGKVDAEGDAKYTIQNDGTDYLDEKEGWVEYREEWI